MKLLRGWKNFELGEIGKIVTGNTPPKIDLKNYGNDIVWIKPPDLDKAKYVNSSSEKISNYAKEKIRLVPEGAVLVSCIGSIGKIAIANCELCTNQQINSIVPNRDIIDSEYLYYTIKKMRPFLEKQGSSAVVPLLNKSEFSKIKISIPPLETQKKIVSLIEKAEKSKDWRKEADDLTKDFLKSVFFEMFGDPFNNKNNFEIKKVKEIVDLINGRAFKPSDWSKKGLKIIRIQNLNNPNANFNYFDGEVKNQYLVENGDLLLSWSGTPGTSFGVFIWTGEKSVLNQHIFNVKIKEKTLNKIYFQYFINAKLMELISKAHGGVGLQHITKAELDNVDFYLPPIELQNKFASIVKEFEAMKEQQKHSKDQIDKLFNALMQKAFKGELSL